MYKRQQLIIAGAGVFFGAALVGPLVIGLYLFTSLQFFGRHSNEAFSSLRIADYKHWLRIVIDAAGDLRVLSIGIDRVGRRGRAGSKPRSVIPEPEPSLSAHARPRVIQV